jgi:hypothetical protein
MRVCARARTRTRPREVVRRFPAEPAGKVWEASRGQGRVMGEV